MSPKIHLPAETTASRPVRLAAGRARKTLKLITVSMVFTGFWENVVH